LVGSFQRGLELNHNNVLGYADRLSFVFRNTDVLAARSQLSAGLDLFDATVNEDAPDGKFVAWRGQLQWLSRAEITTAQENSTRQLKLGNRQQQHIPQQVMIGAVETAI
jgi:hemolysin activation/secretion protein